MIHKTFFQWSVFEMSCFDIVKAKKFKQHLTSKNLITVLFNTKKSHLSIIYYREIYWIHYRQRPQILLTWWTRCSMPVMSSISFRVVRWKLKWFKSSIRTSFCFKSTLFSQVFWADIFNSEAPWLYAMPANEYKMMGQGLSLGQLYDIQN